MKKDSWSRPLLNAEMIYYNMHSNHEAILETVLDHFFIESGFPRKHEMSGIVERARFRNGTPSLRCFDKDTLKAQLPGKKWGRIQPRPGVVGLAWSATVHKLSDDRQKRTELYEALLATAKQPTRFRPTADAFLPFLSHPDPIYPLKTILDTMVRLGWIPERSHVAIYLDREIRNGMSVEEAFDILDQVDHPNIKRPYLYGQFFCSPDQLDKERLGNFATVVSDLRPILSKEKHAGLYLAVARAFLDQGNSGGAEEARRRLDMHLSASRWGEHNEISSALSTLNRTLAAFKAGSIPQL